MIDLVDLHHGEGEIDWPLLRQNVRGAVVKAGDGYYTPRVPSTPQTPPKDYTWHYDPRFVENWNGADGTEVRGAYWFLRLNHDKRPWDKEASIESQAQLFSDLLLQNNLRPGDVVVADIEQNGAQIAYLDQATKRLRVKLFLNLVELHTNHKPIIYCGPAWWDEHIGVAGWEQEYKLWVAHYTNALQPRLPRAWSSYWAWQYTDKGKVPGIRGAADLNRFGSDYSSEPQAEPTDKEKLDILWAEYQKTHA